MAVDHSVLWVDIVERTVFKCFDASTLCSIVRVANTMVVSDVLVANADATRRKPAATRTQPALLQLVAADEYRYVIFEIDEREIIHQRCGGYWPSSNQRVLLQIKSESATLPVSLLAVPIADERSWNLESGASSRCRVQSCFLPNQSASRTNIWRSRP